VSALPALWSLPRYLSAKAQARSHYAQQVPDLWNQVPTQLGTLALVVGVLGAALAMRKDLRLSTTDGIRSLLVSWVFLPFLLFVAFRVGLDNFPLFAVALATLAALGLHNQPRVAAPLAFTCFCVAWLPQWAPSPDAGTTPDAILRALGIRNEARRGNYYRPLRTYGGPDVLQVLDAVCRNDVPPCNLAVDQGLFVPYTETPGQLELFLSSADEVELWDLREPRQDLPDHPMDALVHFDCGEHDAPWRERHPRSLQALLALVESQDMAPVWTRQVDRSCMVVWYTPGGQVDNPTLLPSGGELPSSDSPASRDRRARSRGRPRPRSQESR
jgi:hypothetical protein